MPRALAARLIFGCIWVGFELAALLTGDANRLRFTVLMAVGLGSALVWLGLMIRSLISLWPRRHPEYDDEQ